MRKKFENNTIYFNEYSEKFPDFDSIVGNGDFSIYKKTHFKSSDPIKEVIKGIQEKINKQITFDSCLLDEFEELSIEEILNLSYEDISDRFELNFFNEVDVIQGLILNELSKEKSFV